MNSDRKKTFYSYVIPSVLAFALSGVYTIIDGFFIGQRLGDIGLASITLGYPVAALLQALGTGIGISGGIRFTILKAQDKAKESKECFAGTVILLFLVSILITVILTAGLGPLVSLLGADGATLSPTTEYVQVIALCAVFQLMSTGFVPFIRNMNGASFAMAAMILGFITNIILDYVFVWVLNLSMAGAAWATIIGQAMTLFAAIIFFIVKKSGFRPPQFSKLLSLWKNVLKVSIAPFGLTFSPTVTMFLMNRFLLLHGNEQSVAAYSCIGYVVSIVYLLLQGVGDGSQPLISHYYGENNSVEVKHVRNMAYRAAFAVAVVCMTGLFLTRSHLGILFGASAETNHDVIAYLPLFLATLLFLAYVRITTAYFYATEKIKLSYLLVYAEPLMSLMFMLLLPQKLGLLGVWLAVPMAQVLACGVSVICCIYLSHQNSR